MKIKRQLQSSCVHFYEKRRLALASIYITLFFMAEDEDILYDIAVVGGGINGAGIARDAAGHGLRTILIESKDLASGTSSASTKLIHGGLRYLESYEFGLVRKALKEREILLEMAPHIIWPLNFILPHHEKLRPRWLIRAGLWLYDHLAQRKHLPKSKAINFCQPSAYGVPLRDLYKKGFSYTDCWVEDSRLVILNALDAAERGAHIKTYEPCEALHVDEHGHWHIKTSKATYQARKLVNATGPWISRFMRETSLTEKLDQKHDIRLVKGSHILVPRLYEGEHCYTFQLNDNRVVFAIPYENDYTLIGTTERDYNGDLYDVRIQDDEIAYLCDAVSAFFKKSIKPSDVQWTYSGVRPLLDNTQGEKKNSSAVTRDYRIVRQEIRGAPVVNIYGGKITTYRVLAEAVMEKLGYKFSWTYKSPLPGGDISNADFKEFFKNLGVKYDWMDKDALYRLARAYGTRIHKLIGNACSMKDMGHDFGGGLTSAEIDYLTDHEWARSAEDILFRRTKLGLHIPENAILPIDEYIMERIRR